MHFRDEFVALTHVEQREIRLVVGAFRWRNARIAKQVLGTTVDYSSTYSRIESPFRL